MRVKDKVAIVTGGAKGLGKGSVMCLAREGADIAIIDVDAATARETAEEVKALGRRALVIEADVTDSAQVKRAVQEVLDFFGRIDILVNNAGGYPTELMTGGPAIIERTEEEWDANYRLNLKSQVLMCNAVVPHLVKQKSGKIINIASTSARTPSMLLVCYATAKAAVVHFTRLLARELAKDNINVNCVCPGVIYTPLWEKGAAKFIETFQLKDITPREFFLQNIVAGVPLGREQTPEDIGHAVLFLASDEARNITGHTLDVDGGSAFV